MSHAVAEAVAGRFPQHLLGQHAQVGDETLTIARDGLLEVARFLKSDPAMAFDMPIDVTAVDYLDYPDHVGPRIHVVVHLYSTSKKHRVRLHVPVDLGDCQVPSLYPVWRGTEWFEREVWDMYGVRFTGHPDLRRILLYEGFVGHPLRKDYPLRGYQPLVPVAHLDDRAEDPKLKNVDLNPRPVEGAR